MFPGRPEETVRSPRARVTGIWEACDRLEDARFGRIGMWVLWRQQLLLTSKPSPACLVLFFETGSYFVAQVVLELIVIFLPLRF